MAFTGGKPRDFLISPDVFGKKRFARWRDDVPPALTGKLGAAWIQHLYSIEATDRLGELGLTNVGFQQRLAAEYDGITEDEQVLRKQLRGHMWAQMDDYMLWTQVLGARCIYYSKDRAGWLPPRDLMGPGPAHRPVSS
jgi:hypothetical protein